MKKKLNWFCTNSRTYLNSIKLKKKTKKHWSVSQVAFSTPLTQLFFFQLRSFVTIGFIKISDSLKCQIGHDKQKKGSQAF